MTSRNRPRTLIITGANGVIGSAVCKKALEQGYQVGAFDIHINNLEELKSEFPDLLILHKSDIREKINVKEGLGKVLDKWGKVDGLFNNAGWKGANIREFFQSFEEYSLDLWHDILSVNLDALMIVDQVIGSYMANTQGFGAIIHTASIYGVCAPDQRLYEGSHYLDGQINTPAVYSASKGAVIALTKYLAAYWGDKGVRVNSISPGGIESGQNDIFQEKYSSKVPLGRMGKAEEIADSVLFLLSPSASYINGHNLVVDGGFTIW